MPEERVSLNFDKTLSCISWFFVSCVLEPLEMVELDGNDGASFRVLNLELAFKQTELEPMVSIKLSE